MRWGCRGGWHRSASRAEVPGPGAGCAGRWRIMAGQSPANPLDAARPIAQAAPESSIAAALILPDLEFF